MDDETARLTAGQAAARLGVKPQTLYAYVSRGLLARRRTAAGSTFDALEVEAFAAQRARRPVAEAASAGKPLMVLDTDIALIEDDDLLLRGMPAGDLAREQPFDAVAAWLWGEELDASRRLHAPAPFVGAAATLVRALDPSASWIDRIVIAVRSLAVADPLRDDVAAGSLARAGEIVLAGIPRALRGAAAKTADPEREPGAADPTGGCGVPATAAIADDATVPEGLWHALAGRPADRVERAAINAAMVLSIDHDLAVSTFAARVAASARASAYAITTAALGAFDSPLHGNASHAAADLLAAVVGGVPADAAIRAQLRRLGRRVPGFGQPLYRGIDARAATLLPLVAELDGGPAVAAAVDALREAMRPTGLEPNLDLALAALTVAAGMPADAGAAIFATARAAGWIAHAIAEYDQPALRLRPRGRYVGP